MGQLRLNCLGDFEVVLDGERLTAFQTDKVRALLVYLAVEGAAQTRSSLAQFLWPGYSEESANNNLRQSIHRLRQLLKDAKADPPWLVITRQTVQVNPAAAVQIDAVRFSRLFADCTNHSHAQLITCQPCLARLRQAIDLYRGDFLGTFTVADSDPFEEWRRITQEQLHLQALATLSHLANAAEHAGDGEGVLQAAQRQLALEPWLETAHQRIMRILARRGQRAAALAQYQRCRQVLLDELQIQPDAATTALYEQIRSSTLPEPAPQNQPSAPVVQAIFTPPPLPAPPPTAPPFLAGRATELAQLAGWLERAGAGQGRLGFVVGETGSGKTTLLHAFMAQAQANQPTLRIANGGCDEYSGRGVPFLPWRALFQQLTTSDDAPWLPTPASVAPAEPAAALDDEADPQPQLTQDQLFIEIGARLSTLAAQQPLVLILEDLHWADRSSLYLLLYLTQRIEASRLLLLCSFRPEELTMDGEPSRHPLRQLISESKRRFGQVLIDLSALSAAVRQQFIADWLDQEPNQLGRDFRQALFQHTEGHALFTIELLQELQARGDLQRNIAGEWVARPNLQWQTLPARVEGVIESRMARLPSHLQQLLRVAAIEGEDFTAEVVSRVAAIPLPQVELWLRDELDRRYRLVDVQHAQWIGQQCLSCYRFRHHLFQQYLYHSLNQIEQAHYHAQVGQVLEEFYGAQRSLIALQLARHFAQAGLVPKAIDYYQLAGEKAGDLSANTEAISHFRTALTLLQAAPSLPNPAERELALQLVLGNALVRVHGYAAAEVGQAFHRAHLLYQQVSTLPHVSQAISTQQYGTLLHGLHRFYYMHGEWPAARQVGEQLMALAEQSQAAVLQAEAPRALGMTLWHQGDFTTAQQHFEQGIAAYRPPLHASYLQLSGQDPGMICTAYTAWGMWMLGYPTQAAERLARALALADTFGHPFTLIYALQYAAVLHQFRQDAVATLAQAEAIIALAQQHGFTYYLGWGAILRGWARVQQAQQAAGIAELQQGLASWQATGATLAQHYYYGLLADAYLTLGQPAAGLNAVADGLAAIPGSGRFWEAELYRLQGELLLCQSADQAAQAEVAFQQALAIAGQQGAKLLELRAVCSLSRLWQHQGKTAIAQQRLQTSAGWFTEGFDTPDLIAAQKLLVALSPIPASPAEVPPADLPSVDLPPLPMIGHPHPLPAQLTPLIGRAQQVAELTARLQNPATRLLTIVGAGGMGKTRLAIEIGRTTQTAYTDGVCFVELAAIETATALAVAIATALGIPLQGGEPRNLLLQALGPQQLLLILDNFEQLLDHEATAVALIVDLLTAAPALQILVTSRARLHLHYEQIHTVQPLAFALDSSLAEAAHLAAVQLFVQAAQRVDVGFQLTAANLAAVLRICQLLQGMPLGLELAAANVDQLPLADIANVIAENAAFLAVDWRDMPERQRSLRAVFLWSWRLLDDQERQIFSQLAIFQGSFTRAAAETITGATLPVITRLLHKSLLQVNEPGTVDGRYRIHELLRQFAAAELATAGEAAATAGRHATYYLSLLAAQQPLIMHHRPPAAIAVIQGELDHIRQAWRWGAGHLPAALVEQSALALREFYWLTGLTTEAIEMFDLATQARAVYLQQQLPTPLTTATQVAQLGSQQAVQQTEVRVYSILLGMAAMFQLVIGDHAETLARAMTILQLAPPTDNPVGAALGYLLQGQVLRRQGKSVEALEKLNQSVTLAHQVRAVSPSLLLNLEWRASSWLASIALSNDDYATVRAIGLQQLEICRQFQIPLGEIMALTCLIDVDTALGDYARAQQYTEQALVRAEQINSRTDQALCYRYLAELTWRQGDYQRAFDFYEQALAMYQSMQQVLAQSTIAQMLGRLCLLLGNVAQARAWIEHAFQLLQRLGLPARETSWAYASRGRLHYLTDNLPEALVDAETSLAMVRELDGGASQAEALVLLGLVRERLQPAAAAAAYQEAVAIYTALGHRHHTAEPRAGLARLALAAREPGRALAEIEEVLRVFQDHPLAGFDEPFQVYLTSYTVLAAHQDPRAMPLLTAAHELLTVYAERLLDQTMRRSFLENVASHRDLQAAYATAQASGNQGIGESVIVPAAAQIVTASPYTAGELALAHNLPAVLTPLIGREREVAEISTRLQQAETRLLTIVGAGGMGKTRLAVAVVHALLALRMTDHEEIQAGATAVTRHAEFVTHAYPDGIFFVSLAPLTTAAALVPTIAAALGLETQGDPQSALQHFLQKKRLLLILDNFEHLLAGAPLVTTLLQGAPNLQVLTTSRERLNVRGEQLYPLAGLAYAASPHSAASQLFVQRAQQINPGFSLQATQQRAVQQLSHLVQGMPLALEMAAAWTGDLTVEEIAQEIAQSADFLAVDWPDLPARQRSLRAVCQWSWDLLTPAEQQLLSRLAIFNASFTRAAAAAITGAPVRTLTSLLHKSLIHYARTPETQGSEQSGEQSAPTALPPRYEFHPLTRQFAAEKMLTTAEQMAISARFSAFYLDFLADREAPLLGSEVSETVAEIQREFDHVRQAWHAAITHGQWAELVRSAYCLAEFLAIVGRSAESEQFFTLAVTAYAAPPVATGAHQTDQASLGKLWALVAIAQVRQGKASAVASAQQAIALGAASGALEAQILGHYVCGLTAVSQSHYTAAQSCYDKIRLLFEAAHRQGNASLLLRDFEWRYYLSLFSYASQQGQLAQAQSDSTAGLAIAQRVGSLRGQIILRLNLIDLYLEQGAFARVQAELAFVRPVVQRMRWRWGECATDYIDSFVCCFLGDYQKALTAGQMALTIAQEIGEAALESLVTLQLAYLYALVGDHPRAWSLLPVQTPQEQLELPLHLRYSRLLLSALTDWREGQTTAAQNAATQAWTVAIAFNNRFAQACALIYRGHIRTDLQDWGGAGEDYQAALQIYTTLNVPDVSLEAQAGLAQLALRQGDTATAQRWVEALLPLLAAQSYPITTPCFSYLICYQVLVANHDPRAATILQQGYTLLQEMVASLDAEMRPHFLAASPNHRALMAAYQEWQVQPEQVTSAQVDPVPKAMPEAAPHTGLLAHRITTAPLYDWGEMPAVDFFIGRTTEMAQLTNWLAPTAGLAQPARLVSILGLGGMGKTTLAAAVTKAVAPQFTVVIWRSLLNAPSAAQLLRNWLQILARQQLTNLPETLDAQLRLLLDYLRQERCLLILDNVESIFAAESADGRAGTTRPGYEAYDQLFQRLGSSEHQSCLLLTSREQPYAFVRSGRQTQETSGRMRVLPLTGLDLQAGQELLQSNGLRTLSQETVRLIKNYSGNPLALQIAAATITDFFGGDVAAFHAVDGMLFDGIRAVLDQQFARLSELERDLLIWLAIEREAVTVQTLRSNLLQAPPARELLQALQSLQNRSLLEKQGDGLTLQNVIIEYSTDYLIAQICAEILDVGIWRFASDGDALAGESKDQNGKVQQLYLNRFALLKAQAKTYVRQSQRRLLVQPLAERLVAQLGRGAVLARITHLFDALRAAGVRTGYAAGNLLNLLIHLEASLANVDCSQLAVWQADLRGVLFAAINFTGANLAHTAFTADIEINKIKFRPSGELLIGGISNGELCLWRTVDGQLTAALRWPSESRLPLIFSDDGNWIAVVGADYTIQVWSTELGVCVQTLVGHRNPIYMLAMSKDGTHLASSSADGLVYLWDWRSGQIRHRLAAEKLGDGGLAFSPDGHTLATGSSDGLIQLWDTQSPVPAGHPQATLQAHRHSVGALLFSPDGRWLASGDHDGHIWLWDLHSQERTAHCLQGHTSIIRDLHFQPTRATALAGDALVAPTAAYLLASASADQTVRLWSLTGELRYTMHGHTNEILALAFSADGRHLASSGADQCIYWWDSRTGQLIDSLQAYRYGPTTIVRFSPDGELAVSGSADHLVRLWPVATSATVAPATESTSCAILRGHTHFVRAVAVSPGGQIIASGGADNMIRLWDRTLQRELCTLRGHTDHILALAFTRIGSDRALLASASADHSIRLWSITESQPQVVPPSRVLQGHEEEILTLTFDPTGRTLVSGGMNGSVWLWDVASGTPRLRLTDHTAAVTMVAISPDGSTLATSAFDQTIRLWDLNTGHCLQVKKDEHVGTRAVVFGGQPGTAHEFLAYDGDDFAVYLWPWRTGAPAYALRGHHNVVHGLDVSPTAPLLVSISKDGTLRLWDLETRSCRQILRAAGPYAGMQITGVTGISDAQQAALRALGAAAA